MEIKASSKYDWQTIKAFQRFHNFKSNGFKKAFPIIYIVLVSIFLISFILSCVFDSVDSDLITSLILQIVCFLLLWLIYFVLPKVAFNKNKIAKNSENHFVFRDEFFEISGETESYHGSSEVKYDALCKICETKEFFYLYINPRQAYIVEKATVSEDLIADLRQHLLNKSGPKKYKICF